MPFLIHVKAQHSLFCIIIILMETCMNPVQVSWAIIPRDKMSNPALRPLCATGQGTQISKHSL